MIITSRSKEKILKELSTLVLYTKHVSGRKESKVLSTHKDFRVEIATTEEELMSTIMSYIDYISKIIGTLVTVVQTPYAEDMAIIALRDNIFILVAPPPLPDTTELLLLANWDELLRSLQAPSTEPIIEEITSKYESIRSEEVIHKVLKLW